LTTFCGITDIISAKRGPVAVFSLITGINDDVEVRFLEGEAHRAHGWGFLAVAVKNLRVGQSHQLQWF
jgi:hypothetical protein